MNNLISFGVSMLVCLLWFPIWIGAWAWITTAMNHGEAREVTEREANVLFYGYMLTATVIMVNVWDMMK